MCDKPLTLIDKLLMEDHWSEHELDVLHAIKDCVLAGKPVPSDLQDQYLLALGKRQKVDRYGK